MDDTHNDVSRTGAGIMPAFPLDTPMPTSRQLVAELVDMRKQAEEAGDKKLADTCLRAANYAQEWSRRLHDYTDLPQAITAAKTAPEPERTFLVAFLRRVAQKPAPIMRLGPDIISVPSAAADLAAIHVTSESQCDCQAGRKRMCWHIAVARAVSNIMAHERMTRAMNSNLPLSDSASASQVAGA